jgi:hypothetical protein
MVCPGEYSMRTLEDCVFCCPEPITISNKYNKEGRVNGEVFAMHLLGGVGL